MKTKLQLLVLAAGLVGFGASCTFPSRGTVVDRSHVGRSMNIETGDIIAVRDVTISGQSGTIGTMGGGLVGHAAGSAVGQGTGAKLAGAGGAVAGAVLGSAVEEVSTRRAAQEIQVKLTTGETVAVVQEVKDGAFSVGEHVQVLSGGAGTTVRRMY